MPVLNKLKELSAMTLPERATAPPTPPVAVQSEKPQPVSDTLTVEQFMTLLEHAQRVS